MAETFPFDSIVYMYLVGTNWKWRVNALLYNNVMVFSKPPPDFTAGCSFVIFTEGAERKWQVRELVRTKLDFGEISITTEPLSEADLKLTPELEAKKAEEESKKDLDPPVEDPAKPK